MGDVGRLASDVVAARVSRQHDRSWSQRATTGRRRGPATGISGSAPARCTPVARPDPTTGARAVPIYQTTSFVFRDTAEAANLFALQTFGSIYSRIGNPTVAAFEERLASLEGGIGAVGTASGQAAEFLTMASLAGAGDHLVASAQLYGGTRTLFDVTLRRFGVETTFVERPEPDDDRGRDHAADEGDLRRGHRQSVGHGRRPRRARRRRPRQRPPTRGRLDDRHPVPVPADGARRRHRVALGHQVRRRSRHVDRWSGRRVGPLPVGQRSVPVDDRTDRRRTAASRGGATSASTASSPASDPSSSATSGRR